MGRSTGKFPAIRKQRIRRAVLVIDDEPAMPRLVGKILGKSYDILAAGNGEEGLARAAAELPDLVLLDLNMPDLDGWEVCRRLKADPKLKGIPVVIMTAGESTPEDAERALQIGADEYLVKPFVREVLIHNVERILGTRSA